MQTATSLVAAVAMAAGSIATADVVMDFDTDGFGNPLVSAQGFTGEEYLPFGVRISLDSPNAGPMNLFDTQNPTGGDGDLATGAAFDTPNLGNVLIAQDKGVPITRPDDDEDGARFIFDFTPGNALGISGFSVTMLDIEEANLPNFAGVTTDGTSVALTPIAETLVNPNFPGNNALRTYAFDLEGPLRQVSVEIPNASGALASFSFTAVPAPSTIALLGMGGFAAIRRRRTS